MQEISASLRQIGLQRIVVIGQLNGDRRPAASLPRWEGLEVVAYPDILDKTAKDIAFWRGPSNAPLWVLFSSGTSACCSAYMSSAEPLAKAGQPKAIMHGQLAMILQYKQVGLLNSGLQLGDRHMQITTTGWMMWWVDKDFGILRLYLMIAID